MFKKTWNLLLTIESDYQYIKIGVLEDSQQLKCYLKNCKTGQRSATSMTSDEPKKLQNAFLQIK